MQRGTIILAKFPFTDLSSAKRRPGIVISGKSNDKNDVIIAFISSVIPSNISETDLVITTQHTDFEVTGLKTNSVIKLDKLATINTSVISGSIGSVSNATMLQLDKCLRIALAL